LSSGNRRRSNASGSIRIICRDLCVVEDIFGVAVGFVAGTALGAVLGAVVGVEIVAALGGCGWVFNRVEPNLELSFFLLSG